MKLIIILLCLSIPFTIGCDSAAEVNSHLMTKNTVQSYSKNIILIFLEKPPVRNTYTFKSGITFQTFEPETVYLDDASSLGNMLSPQSRDTIVLQPKNNCVLVKQRVDPYNYTEHVLQRGDTAIFTYPMGYPSLVIKNKPKHNVAEVYEERYKSLFLNKELTPVAKFFNSDMYVDWSKADVQAQLKRRKASSYASSIVFLSRENALLDSLNTIRALLPSEYMFYKNRNKYLNKIIKLTEGQSSMSEILMLVQDKLSNYDYLSAAYRMHLIEAATDKFVVAKAKYMDLKDGVNRDYRQSYTLIKSIRELSVTDKDWLLTREMRRIADTFSTDDFKRYYARYERDVSDTSMINAFRKDYALKFNSKTSDTKSLVLMETNGKQITFETIKKRYTGKVIYVDFWASWCGPCRQALPHSVKLRNELKGKDIVFVYLSIDKTLNPWRTASTQENLIDYKDNYLVVNYLTSDFMKQQKLASIPRYMIFDKKGKLAYANAPGVESKSLPELLISLAK